MKSSLLSFLAAVHAFVALAQSPGAFTVTGSMTTPRFLHTGTLLNDGRVLIAGGSRASVNPIVPLFSAEIYDPTTGTFTATGDMTTARSSHTATLLSDGRVLITGGFGQPPRYLSSAEIYDPSSGTFTATSGMTDRFEPSAYAGTLLPNGTALITRTACAMMDGELYDPHNATFTPIINTTTRQTGPTTTLLTNGNVLIAGGDFCDGDGPVATTALVGTPQGTSPLTRQ